MRKNIKLLAIVITAAVIWAIGLIFVLEATAAYRHRHHNGWDYGWNNEGYKYCSKHNKHNCLECLRDLKLNRIPYY